jgi:hypothetical protein
VKTETLAIGALALLGVGVGAYALAKKQGGASGGQKAAGQSLPASPQVDPSTNPAGISGPSTTDAIKAVQDRAKAEAEERARLEAIQAELARQEAARQAEARRAEIARLTNAAAAVENDQILVLSRIKAITNDNSRLEDFTRQYVNEQVSGGRFEGLRLACWKQSEANCGGRGFLGMGRCWSDNGQGCDPQQTITNGYFKGAWNGNTDLNPWGLIAKEASWPAGRKSSARP